MVQESFETVRENTNAIAEAFGLSAVDQETYTKLFDLVTKVYNAGYVDGREYERTQA